MKALSILMAISAIILIVAANLNHSLWLATVALTLAFLSRLIYLMRIP